MTGENLSEDAHEMDWSCEGEEHGIEEGEEAREKEERANERRMAIGEEKEGEDIDWALLECIDECGSDGEHVEGDEMGRSAGERSRHHCIEERTPSSAYVSGEELELDDELSLGEEDEEVEERVGGSRGNHCSRDHRTQRRHQKESSHEGESEKDEEVNDGECWTRWLGEERKLDDASSTVAESREDPEEKLRSRTEERGQHSSHRHFSSRRRGGDGPRRAESRHRKEGQHRESEAERAARKRREAEEDERRRKRASERRPLQKRKSMESGAAPPPAREELQRELKRICRVVRRDEATGEMSKHVVSHLMGEKGQSTEQTKQDWACCVHTAVHSTACHEGLSKSSAEGAPYNAGPVVQTTRQVRSRIEWTAEDDAGAATSLRRVSGSRVTVAAPRQAAISGNTVTVSSKRQEDSAETVRLTAPPRRRFPRPMAAESRPAFLPGTMKRSAGGCYSQQIVIQEQRPDILKSLQRVILSSDNMESEEPMLGIRDEPVQIRVARDESVYSGGLRKARPPRHSNSCPWPEAERRSFSSKDMLVTPRRGGSRVRGARGRGMGQFSSLHTLQHMPRQTITRIIYNT